MSSYDEALAADPEVKDLIGQELNRQQTTLQLIASENFTSPAVLAATGSVLTNKYSEGYPGRRYYGGNFIIDEVEDLARLDRLEVLAFRLLRRDARVERPRDRPGRGHRLRPGGAPGKDREARARRRGLDRVRAHHRPAAVP
jgi:hypothetical protein